MNALKLTNPKDFKETKSNDSKKEQFLKLQTGENRIRILSKPLEYYEFFIDKKVFRTKLDRSKINPYEYAFNNFYEPIIQENKKYNDQIKSIADLEIYKRTFLDWKTEEFKNSIKEFQQNVIKMKSGIAFVCYDYITKSIKVCSFTQSTISDKIYEFLNDKDYEDLSGFDIKINRKGDNPMNTEYSITPSKHSDLMYLNDGDINILELFHKHPCDLNKLLIGEYPFDNVEQPIELFI